MCQGKNDYNKLSDSIPLKHELKSYEEWHSAPMQFDRTSAPLKKNTMADHIKLISKVMGFLASYRGLQPQYMSLKLFSNQQLLNEYISFAWARSKGTTTQSICNNIYKCQRVVQWLIAKDPEVTTPQRHSHASAAHPAIAATGAPTHVDKLAHLNKVLEYLANVIKNFRSAFPHGKMATAVDTPPPPLPSKDEVLQWQVGLA